MEFLADTTYLIGLWRKKKPCLEFAADHSSDTLFTSWISEGEFIQGALYAGHDTKRVEAFLEQFQSVSFSREMIAIYAEIGSDLQRTGRYKQLGQNDIWQAAVARELNLTLVTSNERHFNEMEGVRFIVP